MPNRTRPDDHELIDPQSRGALVLLARDISTVVSGRVTKGTARALSAYCDRAHITQSEALRRALVLLASVPDNPDASLKALRDLLGLDPAAEREEVMAAIGDLFDAVNAPVDPGADPLGESPEPAPAASKLSASDKAIAGKIANPAARAKFVELRVKYAPKPKAKR